MDEIYSSVAAHHAEQIKVEGSRFLADLFPAENEETAKSLLESVRKQYFDATHHCYAYDIAQGMVSRFSDDGEPSGTAGIKIASAIQSKNLSDVLLVVTRYFGGTKLGAGGLGRAYADAARRAVSGATMLVKASVQEVRVSFPFSETNPVMKTIHSHALKIFSTDYADDYTMITLHLLPSTVPSMKQLLTDATRGAATVTAGRMTTVIWK